MSASVINGELAGLPNKNELTSDNAPSKSSSRDSLDLKIEPGELVIIENPEPETPKVPAMAFTIDFGGGKSIDKEKLDNLAKKSQARHQRVQSMSSSWHKASPTTSVPQKPPLSVNLPRKSLGYNSEGYFSSDQEDSGVSNLSKSRKSPLAQTNKAHNLSKSRSPTVDQEFCFNKKPLKCPIVDNVMTRSDTTPSRQGLKLPLKYTSTTNVFHESPKTPSYGHPTFTFIPRRSVMPDIIDQSPEGVMLSDVSSPEFDMLTPDTHASPPKELNSKRDYRAESIIVPEPIFKKCPQKTAPIDLLEDVDDAKSDSSAGTYTIEGDYTEEQKVKMSIDPNFEKRFSNSHLNRPIIKDNDPELILEDVVEIETPTANNHKQNMPAERNILEITCCYEPPLDNLAAQTSKQIKSTRNYLEKIKSRVKNISDKTFQKSPPKNVDPDSDVGSFTSVTTSGVLSVGLRNPSSPRKKSLVKSQIDNTEFIHRLTRETSVPVSLPSRKNDTQFESTVLRNAQAMLNKAKRDLSIPGSDRLSSMSLNRCRGDNTWIHDWAESVKKFNNNEFGRTEQELERATSSPRPPNSPRNLQSGGNFKGSHSKLPSPRSPLHAFSPEQSPSDTKAYLLKTQSAITKLQAQYNSPHSNSSEKPSKLPIPQLSRSNSLNYKLRRKNPDNSPLRSPGSYVITGLQSPNQSSSSDDKTLLSNTRKYDVEAILSPHRKGHTRHRSFDGRNVNDFFNFDTNAVDLKTVLTKNARNIDKTSDDHHGNVANQYGGRMKRSSSYGTVSYGANGHQDDDDLSDELSEGFVRSDAVSKRAPPTPAVKACPPKMPEPVRKFGPGLVRSSVRVTSKERNALTQRLSEPRNVASSQHQPVGRKLSDTTRINIIERLTKPRANSAAVKKPVDRQKELELSNWKKRTSYDPMRAALEGRKKKQISNNMVVVNSTTSPVHRSQSFQSASNLNLEHDAIGYSSSEEESIDNITLEDNIMIRSDIGPRLSRPQDKRKTFIMEDKSKSREALNHTRLLDNSKQAVTKRTSIPRVDKACGLANRRKSPTCNPRRNNLDPNDCGLDKRKTFILESDTNSSSPRNSSIFSQEKSLTNTSDTENESGTESAPMVVLRNPTRGSAPPQLTQRLSCERLSRDIQPRYLDISKYKSDGASQRQRRDNGAGVGKGSARQIELEQKSKELEKWKRRASYDPRKAAAQSKGGKSQPKNSLSNVLRSQSFHGPMVGQRYQLNETFDASSDNDF